MALELVSYPFVALAYNLPAIDFFYLSALIDTGIFAAYLYATLLICTRLSTRISQVIGTLVPIALFSFYLIIGISDADEHTNYPNYNGRILAPVVLIEVVNQRMISCNGCQACSMRQTNALTEQALQHENTGPFQTI